MFYEENMVLVRDKIEIMGWDLENGQMCFDGNCRME